MGRVLVHILIGAIVGPLLMSVCIGLVMTFVFMHLQFGFFHALLLMFAIVGAILGLLTSR